MSSSLKRSASVTIAGVAAILFGLFLALSLSAAALATFFLKMPNGAPVLPSQTQVVVLGMYGLFVCVSLFGVATGIGLIYLKPWARISILIWGGFSVFFGLIGIPIGFMTVNSLSQNPTAMPGEGLPFLKGTLALIYGIPLATGVWWLTLFHRSSVKVQFSGSMASPDPDEPQRATSPLPITVLGWFYCLSILNLFFLPFFKIRPPIFLFAMLLPDRVGTAILVLSCVAFTVAGVGILKLKPWGYSIAVWLQLLWLTSSAVSMLRPDYKAAMKKYLEQTSASVHPPEGQIFSNPIEPYLGWFLALGVLVGLAVLAVFLYYRPRFLEAAAAKAPASSS